MKGVNPSTRISDSPLRFIFTYNTIFRKQIPRPQSSTEVATLIELSLSLKPLLSKTSLSYKVRRVISSALTTTSVNS